MVNAGLGLLLNIKTYSNSVTAKMATADKKLKVLICGVCYLQCFDVQHLLMHNSNQAGLGGCAAAMAMHYQGFEVVIYEKIRQFQRLGDSLGLGENALRLLDRWGCTDKIKAIGNTSPVFHIRRFGESAGIQIA